MSTSGAFVFFAVSRRMAQSVATDSEVATTVASNNLVEIQLADLSKQSGQRSAVDELMWATE